MMKLQLFFSAALKIESPTRVTVIRSLNIVVSFIVQIQAWNEQPGLDQVSGLPLREQLLDGLRHLEVGNVVLFCAEKKLGILQFIT